MTNNTRDQHESAPRNDASQTGEGPASPVGRRAFIALAALCIASFLGHLALHPQMPEMVPTHWDVAGNVNDWSNRTAVLGLDLLPLGLLVLFRVLPNIDPRGNAYARMGSFYTGFVTVFTLFLIAITWTTELTVFGILPQTGSPVGALVGIAVGIGLVLLGNYLPKVKRNYTFGCKTPWALNSDQNWRLTHRFAGIAMVLAGIATALSGLFSQTLKEAAVWILLLSVLGASMAIYVYSYLIFRNGDRPLRAK